MPTKFIIATYIYIIITIISCTCIHKYPICIGIRPLVTDEDEISEDDNDDDLADDGEALSSEEENCETDSDADS